MPQLTDINDDIVSDASEAILDNLFGDTPEPEAKPASEPEPDEEVKPDADVELEKDLEEEDEDREEDWDAPDKSDIDDDIKDESAARKQAKIRGKEAKELKTRLTERELELGRIQQERDEFKARLEEVEATKIKPEDHADYVEARESILKDARSVSRRLSGRSKELLLPKFGDLMAEYLVAADATDVVEADNKLMGSIVDSLKLSEVPYGDLDEDEREVFRPTIDKVLDLLERNAGKTDDLRKLHASLTEKAKTGHLSVGVRTYENTVKEFKPVFDAIGDLADDVIEANPFDAGSVVAKMIKDSPEAAKRLEKAKADVLEVLVGPRVLTQKEIDKLEAGGTSVKEFLAERAKQHRAKQQKLAAFFVQGLMTRSLLKEKMAKLSKYETDEEADDSEFSAIQKATKKKAKVEAPPEKKKDPLYNLFGYSDD